MPKYLVELEDGKKFQVEADTQPSPDEIAQFMQGGSPIAQKAPEKPFFDLSETLSATGKAFTSLGTTLPASMRQAFGGLNNPWQRSEPYLKSRESMQALQEELDASEAAAQESGDISSVSSAIRGATPSLGFSGSTLVPSLVAGAATGFATKSPAAARSAAAGTSLLMAYRMAGAQFLDDARDRIDNFFQEKLQRPLTPEEQNEAYEELLPLARKFGAAEAGPEALGNLALGGAGKYIRKALGGKNGIMDLASNALSKVTGAKAVAAGVGAAAGEVGTEVMTAVEQDRINQELEQSVLRGASPESVVLPDRTVADYAKAVPNVAPETLAMTGLMGLAGLGPTAINRGYRALRPQAEQQAVETEITTEEPAPAPLAPEPQPVTTLPFNREDIRAINLPFNRDDIRATDLPFSREDIRPTQLPFNREDIRATELPFSRQNIRGLSQLGRSVPSPSQVIAENLVTAAENTSNDASKAVAAARAVTQQVAATNAQNAQVAQAPEVDINLDILAPKIAPTVGKTAPPEMDILEGEAPIELPDVESGIIDARIDLPRLQAAIQQKPDGKTSGPRVTDVVANNDFAKNGGWKLHLSVTPENYQAVDEWLHKNHKGQYKLLSGGSPEEGSDFTIYVGHKDDANSLASKIESEIGSLLNPFESGPAKDAQFNAKVGGRFDIARTGNIKDVPWNYAGMSGVPFDETAMEAINYIGEAPKTREQFAAKAAPEVERIDKQLVAKYGDRYTGTATPSPAMEQPKKSSQIPIGRDVQTSTEMPMLPPTVEAGAGVGEAPVSDVDQLANDWMASQPKGMDEVVIKGAQKIIDEKMPFFGGFVNDGVNLDEGRIAAFRKALQKLGKDLDIANPIGDNKRWKKTGVKNYPVIDYAPAIIKPTKTPVSAKKPAKVVGKPVLGPQVQEMLAKAAAIKEGTETAASTKDEFVRKITGRQPSPQGAVPTPATEGKVMPGGSAMKRDVDPLIQDNDGFEMLKDIAKMRRESGRSDAAMESRIARIEAAKRGENVDSGQTFSNIVVGHPQFEPPHPELRNLIPIFTNSKDEAQAKFDAAYNLLMDVKERIGASTRASMGAKTPAQKRATEKKFPSNETARLRDVVTYLQDETLPELDRLINATPVKAAPSAAQAVKATVPAPSPQTTTVATPTETASQTDSNVGGGLGAPPLVQAMMETFAKASQAWSQAKAAIREQLSSSKEAVFLALAEDDFVMERNGNVITVAIPKGGSDAFSLAGLGTALDKYFRFGDGKGLARVTKKKGEPFTITFGNEADAASFMQYDGRTPSQLNDDFKNLFQKLEEEQTNEASETQTATPSIKEVAASGVASSSREGGRSVALEQESAITPIESTEKADIAREAMRFLEEFLEAGNRKWSPERMMAAQKYFESGGKDTDAIRAVFKKYTDSTPIAQAYLKADKAASEAQAKYDAENIDLAREVEKAAKEQAKAEAKELEAKKKRDEIIGKTLNSLIQKTRTNVVQGTVKPADANQAVAILNRSGEIPNVLFTWIGTSKDFLADPANRIRYPETWAAVSANSKIEGMSENGQPIVFTDNVGVSDLDRKLANLQGTTPEVAAVRRVILHENIHKGMFFMSLKEKMKLFQFLRRLYSPQELDALAESYSEYADWRTNQVSYFSIIEEAMTRDFDSMVEIPRDGIWAEFMQFLRGIWQKITGKTSEPTLKDYKDVFRLIRNSLKNSEKVNADRLKNGGAVRMSMSEFISNVTPEQDREYMAAVEAGDMEAAQRIVDEAARSAGYNTPILFHGTTKSRRNKYGIQSRGGISSNTDSGFNPVDVGGNMAESGKPPFSEFNSKEGIIWTTESEQAAERLGAASDEKADYVFRLYGRQGSQAETWPDFQRGIGDSIRLSDGTWAFRSPEQIKSADPITRDEQGNVIPLSRRFQAASNDIRFSKVGKGLSALFPRQATIQDAYRAASQGQSSQFISLSDVFAKAKEANPRLTEEAFKADVIRLYDSGTIYLEGANSQQEAEAASLSIPGTSVGTAVRIAVPQDQYEPNKTSTVRPYASEGYGSQRMEGVSTGDNSPRAQAIRKAVSESNWNELSPTQRAKAMEDFGLEAISSRYSFDATLLPVRVTNKRTSEGRPASLFIAGANPSIEVRFDTSGLADLLNGDAVTAFAAVYDMAQEQFNAMSQQPKASKVEYDSPNDAAFNSGAEVARNTNYDERDKAVRSVIRAAYDLAPKDNGPSVPLGQLFDIAKQSMPDLTEAEFSQILQDLYEDSGALLQAGESPFIVTTQDGERAGSAIIMPPTDMTKDDVISMLRGMSAANPAPSGGINQELYDTVLTRLGDFISNGGRIPLPIQLDRSGEANMDNYTGKKAGLGGGLRQGSGVGRAGQTDSGTPLFDGLPEGVQGVIPQAQRVESEVSRNREAIAGRGENREGKAGARPDMGMASGGYTFADYAQIASRIGARVQEVSNDIGGGLAVMADENGATTILINAAQLSERMAGISFGLDINGALETIGNALVEELIHAADFAVQREAWLASGRRKPFTEFAIDSDKLMLDEMRAVVASSNDPVKATQILHDAIQASRQLYGAGATPSDIDEFFASPKDTISKVMSEFVRQMIQQDMHQTVSEASLFRRFIEHVMRVLQKIRDAIAPAKAGELGDILKNRINETEMMLALAYQQTGAMASMIDPEDAATKEFTKDIRDIESGSLKAAFAGRQFKDFMPIDRGVRSSKSYEQAAIDYVNAFMAEGGTLEKMANSVIAPDFLAGIGIEDDVMARQALVAEVKNRIVNTGSKKKSKVEKKFFEKLNQRISAFWQGLGTKSGRNQGQRAYIIGNPRYSWMFLTDEVEKDLKERRDNILNVQFGEENATSFTQNSYENADKANQQAAESVASDAEYTQEGDADAELLRDGEATLDDKQKTVWEKVKDAIRTKALIAKALEAMRTRKAGNKAKASISEEARNAIFQMTEEELLALDAKMDKVIADGAKTFLGEESAADTQEKKTVRKKREKMVEVAKKRADKGESIEATYYVPIITENPQRDEIIDDVANSLLQVAKKRGVKPSQKTALADLVASIKSLLKVNVKGEDLKADEVPLGQLLARTYLDNLATTEAELFTQSWNDGRGKVREMLAETGLEGAALEAQLSAIMPATPTIAYNPSAVRKAVTRALREATLDTNDLLANPQETKAEILKVWDKAAVDSGLTPENWQEGRKLAEKSIDEFVVERKAAKERSKQIAKAVVEQSKNPASLADFSSSLAQFKIKPDRVRELFDQAKLLAKKRVQIANDQAIRVLLKDENQLAQSAFFNSSAKPDTIVKAFREQVSDPMERKDFKARMEAMKVSGELADRLFDKAAREKDNAQWKRAQDMLEGPNALRNILREINRARPGEQAPLSKQIPWRQLLSQSAKTVEEYRQRIFDAISANESLKNATPEQKARLADLFTEAWESNRKRILDGMQERLIREKEAKGDLSKKGAEALQAQRMRIVEDINLGIFDNDEIAKIMAEKFGIKSEFTDEERQKIESLTAILQDETLNRVKRNKAAYELLETLSAQTGIPIAKLLANFWVSSVLSGMNTVFSIGMSVFSGMGELTTALSRIVETAFRNPKQLSSEVAAAFKTLARVISAVPRQANRAWQYLVTGDQAFLDPTMNDALKNMDYASIGKNNQLGEQMAKSDKILEKSMGLFMRTVSRLLTALDLFNSGLTKEGSLSIVFRQLDLGPEAIAMLEKRSDLKAYKAQVIQDDFNGVAPKTLYGKALVDSYAMAEMMKALDEIGSVSENADQMAMQGAMTLDPSGIGGYGYRAVKSLMKSAETGADKLLERNLRKWDEAKTPSDKTEAFVKLALSYLFQFGAYNAANLVGVRFARFAGNKFNQSLSFLPVLGALRLYEAEFDSDRIRGKEAFTDMIKRNQLTGVIAAVIGYYVLKAIAEEPDDEKRGAFINGGWSNLTPEKKQQKLAAGQKEYTLGFGDTVINYGNWPGSGIVAAIGGSSDLIRFSPEQWSEKTVLNKLLSATTSGVFSALEVPALSQFQELFGSSLSSKDPNEQKLTKFSRVLGNYAGGFMPRILKDLDYLADPNLRKYETLWEKTASHIPVYRRYEGKEYYDILGQQIQRNIYPGSREFMQKPTDPVYKILGALNSRGIWLTPANAEHRMVGKGARRRKLTQEEADNYGLETGKGYKQMLLRYGQRALQMPTERARDFLLEKADDVRDKALKKVYRGYTPAT